MAARAMAATTAGEFPARGDQGGGAQRPARERDAEGGRIAGRRRIGNVRSKRLAVDVDAERAREIDTGRRLREIEV
jgi:hypothetical protein